MRTKLKDRKLPDYSRGEEIFNMTSHIVGGSVGIAALVLCICISAIHMNIYGVATSIVFGISMILLYTMSSIYHGLKNEIAKKVFQVLDHCTIYILIAGTYTPVVLSALRLINAPLAWIIFCAEWGLAALAITLTAIDIKQYQAFSMICYILMGWGIMPFYSLAIQALTVPGFMLLLAGGIFYTVGAILYAIGKKRKYMHNVFHVFVLFGSIFHLLCIIFFAL
jgi:hemolysin III